MTARELITEAIPSRYSIQTATIDVERDGVTVPVYVSASVYAGTTPPSGPDPSSVEGIDARVDTDVKSKDGKVIYSMGQEIELTDDEMELAIDSMEELDESVLSEDVDMEQLTHDFNNDFFYPEKHYIPGTYKKEQIDAVTYVSADFKLPKENRLVEPGDEGEFADNFRYDYGQPGGQFVQKGASVIPQDDGSWVVRLWMRYGLDV